MSYALRKLKLLVWKNFILQIRRPSGTVVEVILPITLLVLIILARKDLEEERHCFSVFDHKDVSNYDISSFNREKKNKPPVTRRGLAYYPINNKTTEIVRFVVEGLGLWLTNNDSDLSFTSEEQFADDVKELEDIYFCAVTFKNVEASKPLPKHIEYSIRFRHSDSRNGRSWFTRWVYPFFQDSGPRDENLYDAFVAVQHYVDTGIIKLQSGKNITAPQSTQQFPYPDYARDMFIKFVRNFLALVIVLAHMYTALCIVKEIVTEKQSRLKESMNMMGLANWMHWSAWFIKCFLFLLACIVLQTATIKLGKIFRYSEFGVVFLVLMIYAIASISSLFCISVFFSNTIKAMLFSVVLWFASLGPYLSFAKPEKYEETQSLVKAASCLLPNSCLGIMIHIISYHENSKVGATFGNIFDKTSIDENFTLFHCFGMLIFDWLIYAMLIWYIENIFPGAYGISRRWYFPFQPSYWCRAKQEYSFKSFINFKLYQNRRSDFEIEPSDLKVGVALHELNMVFKSPTGKNCAVDGLSLNMYKGQITVLLGHKGAGKTTAMSILTGLFPPTSGEAYINGQNIATQMDDIRGSLGICPQHNVLLDKLTVKENLEFFSALKGVPNDKVKYEIMEMMYHLQLMNQANIPLASLSAGIKRKLNCAIALIGGSKTVFLDEPTFGMDPYTRCTTWDLLKKYRGNKTIVLTTQSMDEADYLGDRIAIMVDGQLRCCGTSLFLKKRYGVGYHMTLLKSPEFQETKTISLISETIPSSKITSNVGRKISFVLQDDHTQHFKELFETLEDKKDEYGISNFEISVTKMEEVFLTVGKGRALRTERYEDNKEDKKGIISHTKSKLVLLTGCALVVTQFKAMFIKRLLNSTREKKAVITQILLPLILVLCGLLLATSSSIQDDDKLRQMSLSMLADKSDKLRAFHADFRSSSQVQRDLLLKMSIDYYSSVSVQVSEQTNNMKQLKSENNGTQMNLPYLVNPITDVISSNKRECCNYKYFVLNKDCVEAMSSVHYIENLCGKVPINFGYEHCLDSAINGPSSISSIPLDDWLTYYQEYILEDSGRHIKKYFNEKVAGLSVKDGIKPYTVWYSNQALHTLPSAFSAGSNIILKYGMNDSDYRITTNNHPLPRNTIERAELNNVNGSNLVLVIFVAMAACLLSASFVTFIVTEKASKAKHIQFVSGVRSISYWGATFCWDFINYLIPALGIVILFAAFNMDDYDGGMSSVALVILLFGCSALPFVYLLSYLFQNTLIAYAVISIVLVVASIAMTITVFICRAVDENKAADILHYVFLLLPTYAFPQALRDISTNILSRKTCNSSNKAKLQCQKDGTFYQDNTLDWDLPGIGVHCLYMLVESIFYFICVILIEENIFCDLIFGSKKTKFSIQEGEDSDVAAERERVKNFSDDDIKNSAVVIEDLTKIYRGTGMTAVDHLTVGIAKAECFGLLGVHGAGKTTTFGMLTGEIDITDGTAYLNGYNLQTHIREVRQRMGYCPQFDALIDRLTGREMLRMFARLRGIPSHIIEDVTISVIEQLNLSEWADKLCGDYSGCNKRKLSTAIALVGDPPIIFLDEPTSGMDPTSRRFLWNTLTNVLNEGRSIVLTSHSMEECEALCTRLVIMVNGQLKCIGSIKDLKSKFCIGFTLVLKLSSTTEQQLIPDHHKQEGEINQAYLDDEQTVTTTATDSPDHIRVSYATSDNIIRAKQFIKKYFEDAYLMEERKDLLQYQIINPDIRWSQMFSVLEENASDLGIVDYSVSQTSLEQVFLNFAKLQHSDDRTISKSFCSCL